MPTEESPPPLPPPDLVDAGFWLRLAAAVCDGMIVASLAIGATVLVIPVVAFEIPDAPGWIAGALLWTTIVWLYHALQEGFGSHATLGKRYLGLRVVDRDGGPVGFRRANARVAAKLLSAAPLLGGFALAGFTQRKQGLHDLVASTRVVRDGDPRARRRAIGVLVAAAVLGLTCASGLRSFRETEYGKKGAEGVVGLGNLARAEAALYEATGAFAPFESSGTSLPGAASREWSAEETQAAEAIGWQLTPRTFFAYRVVVDRTSAGRPVWAACAEADIDGDGVAQALVAFHAAEDARGVMVAPAAPCRHARRLEVPITYPGIVSSVPPGLRSADDADVAPFRVTPGGVY